MARGSPEDTLTTEVNNFTLKEALTWLTISYAFVTDSAKDTGHITKILVTTKGKEVAQAESPTNKSTREAPASQPKLFRFEFDPGK